MKKLFIFLTIIMMVCLVTAFAPNTKKAHAENFSAETDLILPSSYLEYYNLSSPVDVCFDGVNFVVAENKRIVAYFGGSWQSYDLQEYSISKISLYNNFCLFLSSSELFYFHLNDGVVKKANVVISNYFYINGNQLITNPTTSVYKYTLKEVDGELTFIEPTFYDGLSFSLDKFVIAENGDLYYFSEQKIYLFNFGDRSSKEICKNLLGSPRYTTIYNDVIYYSSERGIYSINLSTKQNELVKAKDESGKLPAIVNPQGIYFYNGDILIADSYLNSILSINAESKNFTDFAVTTRSDMPNRINNASDLTSYNENVFVLENNAIKVYNTKTAENFEYSLANFSGAKYMAATSKYFFLSQGAQFYVVEYDGKTLKQVTLDNSLDIDEYKNIVAVIGYEENFYFIDNQSRNSVMKACIFKLSTENMTIEEIGTVNGAGQTLCTDIFGKFYISANTNTQFEYYSFIPSKFAETLSPAPIATTAEKPLSTFVDIEDKLYVLFDNMVLKCFEQSVDVADQFALKNEYTIMLSDNLPKSTNIRLAELLPATDKLYLLSDSLLFSVTSDLGISTPDRLKVPENHKIELNPAPEFAKVNKTSKIFKINIDDMDKEYFDYIEYTTELTENEYIILTTTDRYALIFNQYTAAIVRNSDIESVLPAIKESGNEYYLVDNYGIYSYPTTQNLFKINSVNKNEKIKLIKTITFNGINYCFVDASGKQGYVPETLLKSGVATDNTPAEYYTIKIAKSGAKVFSDEGLTNEIGTLNGEEIVKAIESKNGVTKIYYKGGYGYIADKSIKPTTYYSVRNLIVIICLFVGIFATLIYLFGKNVFTKKQD